MEIDISEIDDHIESLKQIALDISKKYNNNIKIEINVDKEKEEAKVHISVYDL